MQSPPLYTLLSSVCMLVLVSQTHIIFLVYPKLYGLAVFCQLEVYFQ